MAPPWQQSLVAAFLAQLPAVRTRLTDSCPHGCAQFLDALMLLRGCAAHLEPPAAGPLCEVVDKVAQQVRAGVPVEARLALLRELLATLRPVERWLSLRLAAP